MKSGNPVPLPRIVSEAEWQAACAELLAKEKAATRSRDALAAERRRQPMYRDARRPLSGQRSDAAAVSARLRRDGTGSVTSDRRSRRHTAPGTAHVADESDSATGRNRREGHRVYG